MPLRNLSGRSSLSNWRPHSERDRCYTGYEGLSPKAILFSHKGLALRVAPSSPPIVTICWDMTLVTASSEELHVCYKRAQPLLNHSQWWVAETGRDNRCQSSLNVICHLSKFQIIPLLRRKMKAKMLPEFDILINYFLHMRNWLILHVTLEASCVLNCKISKESSL